MQSLQGQRADDSAIVADIVVEMCRRYPLKSSATFRTAVSNMYRAHVIERVGKGLYRATSG
ncbi:hypothetical protein [Deinococcus hopiensis]|nr:hypothetical protein [Deinococcus hopiensis]